MGHMAGSHMLTGCVTIVLLVIKKHIRPICLQELGFIHATQKQGFIETDLPGPERLDDPFMGRSGPCCN